jgi:hypothetical protein
MVCPETHRHPQRLDPKKDNAVKMLETLGVKWNASEEPQK